MEDDIRDHVRRNLGLSKEEAPFKEKHKRIITIICKTKAPFYNTRNYPSHKGINHEDNDRWMAITEEVHTGLMNEIAVD